MSFEELREEIKSWRTWPLENVAVFRQVDSTNLLVRRILTEFFRDNGAPPPVLFLAWEQRAGRGRLGRSWASTPGLGVYATLLWPTVAAEHLQNLPLLVGVGLCRALDPHLGETVVLKWPNDLLVGGRKIGGVLIETVFDTVGVPTAIIGFGVNHGHRREELPTPHATSLRLECDRLPGLGAVALELSRGVVNELQHLGDTPYAIEAYRERSAHRRGDVLHCQLGDRTVSGEFLGFNDRGHLQLATAEGEELITAGEIIEG